MSESPELVGTDGSLASLSVRQLRAGFLAGEFSPVEVIDAVTQRIEWIEPHVEAFFTLLLEEARISAEAAERAYRAGDTQPALLGIPVAVKDLFDTAAIPTTYGSPMFIGHVPLRDATMVQRLRDAGAIVVGKSATHEFGWGITTNSQHFGPTRNPWAIDRTPGGSSGGSAVALACGYVPIAIGTDTGGSTRIPGAFCGVVGHRPSAGRLSKAGLFPLAPSLDEVGVMARNPADANLLLGILEGPDPDDPYSFAPMDRDPLADLERLSGLRVGVSPDLLQVPLAADIDEVFQASVARCEELGARVIEVDFPESDLAYAAFGAVQRAEAAHVHERAGLFPRRTEYGSDVRSRLDRAAEATLADYLNAQADRQRIRARFHEVFHAVDLLVSPISAVSPPIVGNEHVLHMDRRVLFREAVMGYTVPQSLAGLPSCSVRAGFDRLGIPVGVQITGPGGADRRVLAVAGCLFAATPELQRRWPDPVPPRSAEPRRHEVGS